MSWVKLDDQFFRHKKVLQAGRDARDLYLAGLCFCASSLTDGHIPSRAVRVLAADAEIDNGAEAAAQLVKVGLWEVAEDGYTVHDYLLYNPTKEQAEQTRAVRAEAGRTGGQRSGESRRAHIYEANAKQNGSKLLRAGFAVASPLLEANAKQNRTPSPSPYRSQDQPPSTNGASVAVGDSGLPENWAWAWEQAMDPLPLTAAEMARLQKIARTVKPTPHWSDLKTALEGARALGLKQTVGLYAAVAESRLRGRHRNGAA